MILFGLHPPRAPVAILPNLPVKDTFTRLREVCQQEKPEKEDSFTRTANWTENNGTKKCLFGKYLTALGTNDIISMNYPGGLTCNHISCEKFQKTTLAGGYVTRRHSIHLLTIVFLFVNASPEVLIEAANSL